jgi:branched-chain amino acid transport system ATP-binding protein
VVPVNQRAATAAAAAGQANGAALAVSGVTVRFEGVLALDDVSFSAAAQSITCLIGPNGAGKSTMLGVISGLVRPQAGQVTVHGQDVTHAGPQRIFATGVARSFQVPQLIPQLTVRQHIVLAHRAASARHRLWRDMLGFGGPAETAAEREYADQIADRLRLTGVRDDVAGSLPMGLRRLVEVGQCLAADPRVLLLDEPSAGLNRAETDAFAAVVRELAHTDGVATVIVEHDLEFVLNISDRIVVLDFGRLVDSGPPAQIRASEAVRAAYFGRDE